MLLAVQLGGIKEAFYLKKSLIMALLTLILLTFPAMCWADQAIRVEVDGRELILDQSPIVTDGHIMMPLRAPLQALGCTIAWDSEAQQAAITSGSTTITFSVGSTTYIVNGEEKYMDVAPEIINEQVFFPIRYALEALGANMTWEADTQTLKISSPKLLHTPDGLSAHQLITQADKAAAAQKANKFREKRQMLVKNSMVYSWGKTYQSNDISYSETQGHQQYSPSGIYEAVKAGVPPFNAEAMVIEDKYEKVTKDSSIFIKTPTGVWVKTEEQTPDEFLKSVGKSEEDVEKDLVYELSHEEKLKDKDCQVVSYSFKPEFFEPMIKNLVEQQLAVSETDPETNRSIWEQVGKTMKAAGSGKVWIERASGLRLFEESTFSVKFSVTIPVQNYGSHTMHYSYDMQDTSLEEYYDYGLPVTIPDVSKAISSEEYAQIQSNLFDAGIL